MADAHAWAGVVGFAFACFAVVWAWIQYSWFASAYDTDDWVFRIATMVQMAGVVVLALGLPQMFESIDHGDTLDNGVMVTGYVIMRVPLIFLWLQVARHDPERAPAAHTYAVGIAVAQVGWIAFVFLDLPVTTTFACFTVLYAIELAGPFLAERKAQTPWHAHHIAERYGLLTIITLGEVIIGTVAALNALVHGEAGWTTDAVLLTIAGVGLCFGCWWAYFAIAWAEAIERRRRRAFVFGYGHLLVFGSLAAMGAGLHVAAYRLEGEAKIGDAATVLSVAIPVAVFLLTLYALYSLVMREHDAFHLLPARGHRGGAGARDRAGRGRGEHGGLPARAHARAGGDDRRLRDRRPPPHAGGARAALAHAAVPARPERLAQAALEQLARAGLGQGIG